MIIVSKTIKWANEKYILPTHQGSYAFCKIEAKNCNGSMANYMELAAEMRKTFPKAVDPSLLCSEDDNYISVNWNNYIEKKDYEGWTQK